jgi:hypothetical protein
MSEIDWSALQAEAKTAGLVPDGEYNVIVTEALATKSSNGKPMIKAKLRITDGPHAKKPLYTNFTISPESAMALRMYFLQMAAFGLDSQFFGQNPSLEAVASNLMNRSVTVTVTTTVYQGQDRNQVNGVKPLQGSSPMAPGVVTGPPSVGSTGATPTAPPTAAPSPLSDGVAAPVQSTSAPSAPPTTPF